MRTTSLHGAAIVFLTVLSVNLFAQAPERMTSADIHNAIKKLGVVGSALYVAAHPDDENTRLISYLSNELKVNTTYLSMTRGDGGQNLVGPEIRELLGVIRTQELLMARSVDGGSQLFTRANDFGYSKTPEETLKFWNTDEVMADVVWAIRKTRPDIIINRFPHEHLNGNHGHHTTSAMLSYEAFDMANDPSIYPEQLPYVDTWQPRRMFFNTSWWFYGSREKFAEADKSRMVSVDAGVYYPMDAISNPEVSALSRSMHKSQGFGSSGTRGEMMEYLDLLKGDMPEDPTDPFGGIDLTWNRVEGGGHIGKMVEKLDKSFSHEAPHASLPDMMEIRKAITALPDSYWKRVKLEEINKIIVSATGLYVDARADSYWGTPGDSVGVVLEVTNRSAVNITLISAEFLGSNMMEEAMICLPNKPVFMDRDVLIAPTAEYTSPYWLVEEASMGMYTVEDQLLRGLPENKRELGVQLLLDIEGTYVEVFRPLVYQRTDPVKGEVYRPFEVVPPAFVNFDEKIQVLADDEARTVRVRVKSSKDDVSGTLAISASSGWNVEPSSHEFSLGPKGDEAVFEFSVIPPSTQNIGEINAIIAIGDKRFNKSITEIEYDHIPTQTILTPASAKVVKVDLRRTRERIGYIMGAGDEVANSLEQVGYSVDILNENDIELETLKGYDAIIIGVRAYNTSDRIRFYQDELFEYVKQGGNLITQYNTSRRLKTQDLAPYPLALSRERVTDEMAEVKILEPDHPVMQHPNPITQADFDLWVQERGLYFPNEWDDAYTAVLSMNDRGEDEKRGSLLIAKYGDGHFVYTGLSWFRQLPAGVPGAYRLFTNMIELGGPSKS